MQSALNIDIPDASVLLDDMAFPDGGTIPAEPFIQPRIEAEIAFVMSASKMPDPFSGENSLNSKKLLKS
jgi:2-oxo-hept-3-ene-1,7-dioate hydratase